MLELRNHGHPLTFQMRARGPERGCDWLKASYIKPVMELGVDLELLSHLPPPLTTKATAPLVQLSSEVG